LYNIFFRTDIIGIINVHWILRKYIGTEMVYYIQRHIPYKPLLDTLNKNSLATRRNLIDLMFLYKVVNGIIISSELLNYLNFYVSQCQTISTNTFYKQLHRTNYLINAPINRMM